MNKRHPYISALSALNTEWININNAQILDWLNPEKAAN
jgi:hypothetical protein